MAWSLLLSSTYELHNSKLNPFPLLPSQSQTPNFTCKLNHSQFHHRNSISIRSFNNGGPLVARGPARCQAQNKNNKNIDRISSEGARTAVRRVQQVALWAAEAIYILWLFLLPYAPGDPVWAIKSSTIGDLLGLSLNFFFVLPVLNYAGIHVIEAPVLHPVSEGLFNFVIAWTLLFAPLLFTDRQRDRYRGSLDVLWGFQMFLTNTFLIPYMAIRLNDVDSNLTPPKPTQLASLMTRGATVVGVIGGAVCLFSVFWALFARGDGGFGGIEDRWEFFVRYIGSERLAYAFIWDICLYSVFQPWLIGDNLQNVKQSNKGIVTNLRFIPVLGLVAYLVSLDDDEVLQ